MTWAFHLTFTLSTLRAHQTDIREGGRLFSYSVIYFLNLAGLCLGTVVVGAPTLEEGLLQWDRDLRSTWRGLAAVVPAVARLTAEAPAEAPRDDHDQVTR